MPLATIAMTGSRASRPPAALIEFKNLKFYISEQPSDAKMMTYVKDLQTHKASYLVRVGGYDYSTDAVEKAGINVVDLPFADGSTPDDQIVKSWFKILKQHVLDDAPGCVAIHCRAGLGRSPVLVAVTLIELGMKYEDAVSLIRAHRPGAINAKQLEYLSKFRQKSRLASKTTCLACLAF